MVIIRPNSVNVWHAYLQLVGIQIEVPEVLKLTKVLWQFSKLIFAEVKFHDVGQGGKVFL
jgi:hypothetical protein